MIVNNSANKHHTELYYLANQLQRMSFLGNIQTFQIEFDYLPEDKREKLEQTFNDSTTVGQFKSDMIILSQMIERDVLKIVDTLTHVQNIFGDLSIIDAISALVEIKYKDDSYFVVVSYNPKTDGLELISTSESKLYFELLNYIRAKWVLSKQFLK
ncbi:MAG: hypothetical protein ACTSYD_00645 [Candidatus Heimdallarchaeaceae archaeon]